MDIRDIVTGESLFKLTLNQMVIAVMQADYRGRGASDLVICMRNGDGKRTIFYNFCLFLFLYSSPFQLDITVKGYERSKINLASIRRMDHNELSALMTTKKSLQLELTQYQSNAKVNKDHMEYVITTLNINFEFQIILPNILVYMCSN